MVEPQRGGRITLFSAFLGVNPSGLQFLHHAALVKVENSKGYIVTPRRTLIKKKSGKLHKIAHYLPHYQSQYS